MASSGRPFACRNKGPAPPPKKTWTLGRKTFFLPTDSLIACAVCVSGTGVYTNDTGVSTSATGVYRFHGVRPCFFSQKNIFISLCIRSFPPLWSPPAGVPVRAPRQAISAQFPPAGILFSGISFLILQGDERRYAQKTEDIGGVGKV